ncbi:MAG: hypothetical protein H7Y22_02820 [Gemmatimonadaceae bacterium]|nr:hypothetical protein [Gloeobacterales cyanobacterium ES-bin-141]
MSPEFLANNRVLECLERAATAAIEDADYRLLCAAGAVGSRPGIDERLAFLRSVYPDFERLRAQMSVSSTLLVPLWRWWLPLVLDIERQVQGCFVQGVLGGQGSGKTTLGRVLTLLLAHRGLQAVSLSLDDIYLTWPERERLRERYPEVVRRGPPGTHDIGLGLRTLCDLKAMTPGGHVWVPRFDKSAHGGQGDRFAWVDLVPGMQLVARVKEDVLVLEELNLWGLPIPLPTHMGSPLSQSELIGSGAWEPGTQVEFVCERAGWIEVLAPGYSSQIERARFRTGWSLVTGKVDVVLFEGWFVGVRPLSVRLDEPLTRLANDRLAEYLPLWDLVDRLLVLQPADYGFSKGWRREAEQKRTVRGEEGMTDAEIDEFVEYFWRALPPELFVEPLTRDPRLVDLVATIGADRFPTLIYRPGAGYPWGF